MIDINKFDDLQDLPISEEMLGAYIEGNLHGAEFREVDNFILSNADIVSLIDTVEDDFGFIRDVDLSYQQDSIDLDRYEDMLPEMSLPDISILGTDSLIETSCPFNDDIIFGCDCHNYIDDGRSIHSGIQHNNQHQHHDPELDFGLTDNIE